MNARVLAFSLALFAAGAHGAGGQASGPHCTYSGPPIAADARHALIVECIHNTPKLQRTIELMLGDPAPSPAAPTAGPKPARPSPMLDAQSGRLLLLVPLPEPTR